MLDRRICHATGLALATKLLSMMLCLDAVSALTHTHTQHVRSHPRHLPARSQALDAELEPDDLPEYPLMEDEVRPHSIQLPSLSLAIKQRCRIHRGPASIGLCRCFLRRLPEITRKLRQWDGCSNYSVHCIHCKPTIVGRMYTQRDTHIHADGSDTYQKKIYVWMVPPLSYPSVSV